MYQQKINRIVYKNQISEQAKKLIWEIFFLEKKRGLTFSTHFPWIDNGKDFFCVTHEIVKNGQSRTVSALILKIDFTSTTNKIGLIGLVCVDPAYRGKGLSNQLLLEAIELAKSNHLSYLLLWTSQPWLYTKVGFKEESREVFGIITRKNISQNQLICDFYSNFKKVTHYGVPAFAEEIFEYSDEIGTTIIFCKSKKGLTLARWRGDVKKILLIINSVFEDKLFINTLENDDFLRHLETCDYNIDLRAGAICMKLDLGDSSFEISGETPYLDILQRI